MKNQSLARTLVMVMNARELESERVARVLHDEIGQVLSAVGLQLDVLRMDFQESAPGIVQRTAEIQNLLERAIVQLRELSHEIHPTTVERVGFPFAMERLVSRAQNSFAGEIRLEFDHALHPPTSVVTALYKLAETAIENAVQHSGARRIDVTVKSGVRDVVMEVRDNGRGFDVVEVKARLQGLGLLVMDYLAAQAGIRLEIQSAPGGGTIVKASYRLKKGNVEAIRRLSS